MSLIWSMPKNESDTRSFCDHQEQLQVLRTPLNLKIPTTQCLQLFLWLLLNFEDGPCRALQTETWCCQNHKTVCPCCLSPYKQNVIWESEDTVNRFLEGAYQTNWDKLQILLFDDSTITPNLKFKTYFLIYCSIYFCSSIALVWVLLLFIIWLEVEVTVYTKYQFHIFYQYHYNEKICYAP